MVIDVIITLFFLETFNIFKAELILFYRFRLVPSPESVALECNNVRNFELKFEGARNPKNYTANCTILKGMFNYVSLPTSDTL